MTSPEPSADAGDERPPDPPGTNFQFSWWNLLLLIPLLMLITPVFNKDRPRLFGWPFFYWYQMAWVFIGVACVWIVYVATKHLGKPTGAANSGMPDVEETR